MPEKQKFRKYALNNLFCEVKLLLNVKHRYETVDPDPHPPEESGWKSSSFRSILLSDGFACQNVLVISVNKRGLSLPPRASKPSKAPHGRTEPTGANQHLCSQSECPHCWWRERKKRRSQVFRTSPGTSAAECYPNMFLRDESGCVLEAVAIMMSWRDLILKWIGCKLTKMQPKTLKLRHECLPSP